MDPDPHQLEKWDLDPDPDPHQNVLDPPHCFKGNGKTNQKSKGVLCKPKPTFIVNIWWATSKKKFRLRAVLHITESEFSNFLYENLHKNEIK